MFKNKDLQMLVSNYPNMRSFEVVGRGRHKFKWVKNYLNLFNLRL